MTPRDPASSAKPARHGDRPRSLDAATRHPVWLALGLIVAALLVLGLVWDWNWFKRPVERQVEARTGRPFEITGDLDVDLGWTPVVSATGLRFGNAQWASRPTMAEADKLEFAIHLHSLLRGEMRIPMLRLSAPRLSLERGPDRRGNWQFGDGGGDGPSFRRIWIEDGQLQYLDPADKTSIEVEIASERGEDAGAPAPVSVDGGGTWKGSRFTVQGRAESPLELRDRDSPYRIDARAQAGNTRAHARGTLLDPLRLRDFDLQLALSGKNLEELYPLIGVALPPTPAYRLDGRFSRDDTRWLYQDFTGTVGDSDLRGDASVDTGGDRPYLRADLRSKVLDFDDLAGFIGAAPQSGKGETGNPDLESRAASADAPGRVLPHTSYDLAKLRSMDADVRWKAVRIQAPSLPLDDMDAHLMLENGLLRLEPLNFGVAGGDIRSTIRMDARENPIRTRTDIKARGLDISRLAPEVELSKGAIGKLGGNVMLAGHGNSVAQMLGNSDGDVALAIGKGSISNLLMEMAGIDLAEIIKFKLQGDRQIPIRCAFGEFKVDDGVMRAQSLAFDTSDTILIGEGSINLREETLDLTIRPRPKDRSLLALRAPLLVGGTFASPDVRPDYKRVGLRAAIALTLGSIAAPAALLGTLELGPGDDAQCGGTYAK
ncbi:MAG: AsmA family protein [Pseudomonadota bacterium]|nr:AsmA family protein [Pseudomonadota bacterium]